MFCRNCGKEINEQTINCPNCGALNINTAINTYPKQDNKSTGLCIVSFLLPLVGLILYLVKKDESPNAAKSYGKCALISVIVSVILSIILSILYGVLASVYIRNKMASEPSIEWHMNDYYDTNQQSNNDIEYDFDYNYN